MKSNLRQTILKPWLCFKFIAQHSKTLNFAITRQEYGKFAKNKDATKSIWLHSAIIGISSLDWRLLKVHICTSLGCNFILIKLRAQITTWILSFFPFVECLCDVKAAILVSPTNPLGTELYSYTNVLFYFGWKRCSLITWVKTLYSRHVIRWPTWVLRVYLSQLTIAIVSYLRSQLKRELKHKWHFWSVDGKWNWTLLVAGQWSLPHFQINRLY